MMLLSHDKKSVFYYGGSRSILHNRDIVGYSIFWKTLDDPSLITTLDGHHAPVHDIVETKDGRYLFSTSADTTVCQWSLLKGGSYVNTFALWSSGNALAVTLCGTTLFAGFNKMDRIDVCRGVTTHIDTIPILSMCIHEFPDSSGYIFLGSSHGQLHVHDLVTTNRICQIEQEEMVAMNMKLSPDGTTLMDK
jgi:WD40 repeat protein